MVKIKGTPKGTPFARPSSSLGTYTSHASTTTSRSKTQTMSFPRSEIDAPRNLSFGSGSAPFSKSILTQSKSMSKSSPILASPLVSTSSTSSTSKITPPKHQHHRRRRRHRRGSDDILSSIKSEEELDFDNFENECAEHKYANIGMGPLPSLFKGKDGSIGRATTRLCVPVAQKEGERAKSKLLLVRGDYPNVVCFNSAMNDILLLQTIDHDIKRVKRERKEKKETTKPSCDLEPLFPRMVSFWIDKPAKEKWFRSLLVLYKPIGIPVDSLPLSAWGVRSVLEVLVDVASSLSVVHGAGGIHANVSTASVYRVGIDINDGDSDRFKRYCIGPPTSVSIEAAKLNMTKRHSSSSSSSSKRHKHKHIPVYWPPEAQPSYSLSQYPFSPSAAAGTGIEWTAASDMWCLGVLAMCLVLGAGGGGGGANASESESEATEVKAALSPSDHLDEGKEKEKEKGKFVSTNVSRVANMICEWFCWKGRNDDSEAEGRDVHVNAHAHAQNPLDLVTEEYGLRDIIKKLVVLDPFERGTAVQVHNLASDALAKCVADMKEKEKDDSGEHVEDVSVIEIGSEILSIPRVQIDGENEEDEEEEEEKTLEKIKISDENVAKTAARAIQSLWRSRAEKKELDYARRAALFIQARFRANRARKLVRDMQQDRRLLESRLSACVEMLKLHHRDLQKFQLKYFGEGEGEGDNDFDLPLRLNHLRSLENFIVSRTGGSEEVSRAFGAWGSDDAGNHGYLSKAAVSALDVTSSSSRYISTLLRKIAKLEAEKAMREASDNRLRNELGDDILYQEYLSSVKKLQKAFRTALIEKGKPITLDMTLLDAHGSIGNLGNLSTPSCILEDSVSVWQGFSPVFDFSLHAPRGGGAVCRSEFRIQPVELQLKLSKPYASTIEVYLLEELPRQDQRHIPQSRPVSAPLKRKSVSRLRGKGNLGNRANDDPSQEFAEMGVNYKRVVYSCTEMNSQLSAANSNVSIPLLEAVGSMKVKALRVKMAGLVGIQFISCRGFVLEVKVG